MNYLDKIEKKENNESVIRRLLKGLDSKPGEADGLCAVASPAIVSEGMRLLDAGVIKTAGRE